MEEWAYRRSLALIAAAFLGWGFLRSLNDVIIPVFQSVMGLSYAAAMLVYFSFFSAYLFASRPTGWLIERCGYRAALTASTLLMASGAALFIPAASHLSFPWFLVGILILATGITALQVSANPWITLAGDPSSAVRRLLLLQAFVSIGSVAGPVVGRVLLPRHRFAGVAGGQQLPGRPLMMIYGYSALVLLAVMVLIWLTFSTRIETVATYRREPLWHLLNCKPVRSGSMAIFLLVGAEASILGHGIRYFSSSGAFAPRATALLLSGYWAGVMVGRLAGAALSRRVDPVTLLRITGACAFLVMLVALLWRGTELRFWILSTGLFNSVMFPAIFACTIVRVHRSQAPAVSALLTTAICGGALISLLSGACADHFGLTAALLPPLACYFLIAVYAFSPSCSSYEAEPSHFAR